MRSLKFPRLWLAAAVAVSVVPLAGTPAAPALAASSDEVVFEGSGFGHGVGMSQYGAYARALAGQTRDDILLSYYTDSPNTQVSTLGVDTDPLPNVFVNVGSDLTSTTLTVAAGGGAGTSMTITRIGGAPGQMAELSAGDTVEIVDTTPDEEAPGGCKVTLTLNDVETIWGLGSCDFDVSLQPGDGLPEEVVTATNCRTSNCTFGYGEVLHIVDNGSSQRTQPDRIGGVGPIFQGFDLVVEATLDDYTRGIAEVPFAWPATVLEVQAIAARSYAASYVASTDYLSEGCFCDLKNDATRQVYAGWLGGRDLWNLWDAAALATNGNVLTHPQAPENGFIRAFYSSSNGGSTEQGYDNALNPLPYLLPVSDPFSLAAQNPYRSWTVTIPAATLENALWSGTHQLDYVEIEKASVAGKVQMVRFTATDGSTSSLTPKEVSDVIRSTAACTKADGFACAGSASPFPSYYFDVAASEAPPPPPPVVFTDIDDTIHKADIEYLASLGVAIACDAGPDVFCPDDRMRREDLAAFIVRALDLPLTTVDYFHDDDGLPFEADINSLAEARITLGCNPPVNDEFCPDDTVTRGQTAAFIVRAWSLTDGGAGDRFIDDDVSVFERDIDRLAQAGITKGCNPPDNTEYCPTRLLTRAEMSSFLARALRDL